MPFISLDEVTEAAPLPGFNVHFVHSDTMTFAYWRVEAGSELPEHSHPHEQVATVVEGEFELTVGEETQVMRPGSVAIIPSNCPHSGRALSNCRIMDAFYPIREDYRTLSTTAVDQSP